MLSLGNYVPLDQKEKLAVFSIDLQVPIFEKIVKVKAYNLPSLELETEEFKALIRTINDILSFSPDNINWMIDKIWMHYNMLVDNSSYNMVDYDGSKNIGLKNREYFNIATPKESFQAAILDVIHFDMSQTDYPHFNLVFSCPWKREHGILICAADGRFETIE